MGFRILAAAAICLWPVGSAAADCVRPGPVTAPDPGTIIAPATPDPSLRPDLPACLRNIDSAIQQNCSDAEVAAFGTALEIYVAALRNYVAAADRYAAQTARAANAMIEAANAAGAHADAAYAFATCEADALRAAGR